MIASFRKSPKSDVLKMLSVLEKRSWVYVEDPTPKELEELERTFGLDSGHLADALDPYEMPRLESEDGALYVFTRIPQQQGDVYASTPVLFIIGENYVVTVSRLRLPMYEKYLTGKRILETGDRTKMFLQLFEDIVNSYTNVVTKINKNVKSATDNMQVINNKDIVALVRYEYILNELLNAIIQTNSFLLVLGKNRKLFPDTDEREQIEDLYLATGQIVVLSKSSLQHVKNIRDAYSTIMTNNLNKIIKFFTTLTIILTIPTIIASLYGMNVVLPFQDHPQAFLLVIVGIFIVSGTLLGLFAKKHWL